jgi:hypothetical protein
MAVEATSTTGIEAIEWTDEFVEDIGKTFQACQMFLFFPVYNLNDGGIGNIVTSQVCT